MPSIVAKKICLYNKKKENLRSYIFDQLHDCISKTVPPTL